MENDSTVLKKVFASFLAKLQEKAVPPSVIKRIAERLDKRDLKAESLKSALFTEEDLP
jgi:hypothetical protein